MAMKCSRCDYVAVSGSMCPKCGAPLRMSLLPGSEQGGQGGEVETVTTSIDPPGAVGRFIQWLVAVAAAHLIGGMIVSLTVVALMTMGINVNKLPEERPDIVTAMSILVPMLATALAIVATCRGVYLAQLVGLPVGLTCAIAAPLEKMAFEYPVAWYEWLILPPLCAAAGFWMGMRVTGTLHRVVRKQIKKTDSWDPKAQSKAREITPPSELRWQRLFLGAVVGATIIFGVRYGMNWFFSKWYSGQSIFVGQMQTQSLLPLTIIGLAGGGMLAGSRTQNGFTQGLWAGLLMLGIGYVLLTYFMKPVFHDELWRFLVYYLAVPPVAGFIGRYIFRPSRVFKSSQDENL